MSSSSESDSDCDKQEQSTSGRDISTNSNATVSEPELEGENSIGEGLLHHGRDEDGPGSRSCGRDSERYTPNNDSVDAPHPIEGEGRNNRKSLLLEFNNDESNQASWGLWLMISLSINVGFLFAILYLVQNLSGRVSNMELNTWDNNVAMDNLKYMCIIEQNSLRSEIESMKKAATGKHDQQLGPEPETERNNKIHNVGENRSGDEPLPNKETVDEFQADGYHRNGNMSLQECHDESNQVSWGLIRLILSVSINVAVLFLVLYLVQKAALNTKIRRIEENVIEFEKELGGKVEKMQKNFTEFVLEYELDRNPAYAPYVQMKDQLKDLNWIQNMLQTTTVPLKSSSKESWLTECKNALSLFDKNGDFKSSKRQNNEIGALLDKSELSTFASNLRDEKHYRQALGLYEKMYKRSRDTRGINHVNTLRAQYGVALCLNNLKESKETKKALELYRFVQEKRSETLHPTHADTLNAQHSIAVSLHRLGRYKEALHLYEDVYSLQVKNLGVDHEHTVQTKLNMEIAKSRK